MIVMCTNKEAQTVWVNIDRFESRDEHKQVLWRFVFLK